MRVLINTLASVGNKTGVGHYTSQLIQALLEVAPGALNLYPSGLSGLVQRKWIEQWLRYDARRSRPGVVARGEALCRRAALALTRRAGYFFVPDPFRRAIRQGSYDLYHEPNFIAMESELPAVASVHDLSVLLHPEWHPPKRVEEFTRTFHDGLKRCVHLIAISEFGKSEIVKHLGWPEEKVSVTYMGVRQGLQRVEGERLAASLRALNLKEGYLLHVGTLEPRKNVLMLMKAYCDLPACVREKHPLVLVGGKGWNSDEVHTYLNDHARHHNVRWLGYVQEKHFPALYSAARALVFPTFYEGFGMPTVEMFATGGAVLASTAGAVAETAGSQAHLIDPHDLPAWRDSMLRVCTDQHWWLSLRHGAVQAASRFTWHQCALDTLTAYRRAISLPQSRAA